MFANSSSSFFRARAALAVSIAANVARRRRADDEEWRETDSLETSAATKAAMSLLEVDAVFNVDVGGDDIVRKGCRSRMLKCSNAALPLQMDPRTAEETVVLTDQRTS